MLFLQEYSIQITFRQQWNDHRLKFDSREGKINYCGSTQVFNFSEDKRDQIIIKTVTLAFSPLRQKKINHPYAICISFTVHKLVITLHSETYL